MLLGLGGILALISPAAPEAARAQLARAAQRAPARGEIEFLLGAGFALAIQRRGHDASLATAGRWRIAFHGFVGNWVELRARHGPFFDDSDCDARRLAGAFERLGEVEALRSLRGEFAALVVDVERGRLLAARDLLGRRPLFHSTVASERFFASEIRQVLAGTGAAPALDVELWRGHFAGRPRGERTPHPEVRRIYPGEIWQADLRSPEALPLREAYWTPPAEPPRRARIRPEEARAELRRRLEAAVERTLPAGAFGVSLSGGFDSSGVWGLARHLTARGGAPPRGHALTLSFPGLACDETALVQQTIAFTGGELTLLAAGDEDPFAWLPGLAERLDQPFATTAYQTALIAAGARRQGLGVVLSGLGEEWYGGGFGFVGEALGRGNPWPLLRACTGGDRYLPPGLSALASLVRPALGTAWRGLRGRLKAGGRPETSQRRRLLGRLEFMRSCFPTETREQAMEAEGVEVRHPLEDRDLVEFGLTTRDEILTGGRRLKHLYRAALDDVLAPSIRALRRKITFESVGDRGLAELARQGWQPSAEVVEALGLSARQLSILTALPRLAAARPKQPMSMTERARLLTLAWDCRLFETLRCATSR